MALSDADKAFLSQPWRYVEITTPAIQTAHPGARDAERSSPFVTAAGATAVLTTIHSILSADAKLFQVVVDGILSLSFAGKPPSVTLFADRFNLSAGRTGIVTRIDKLWSKDRTLLHIWG
jgi:hypothetical protein